MRFAAQAVAVCASETKVGGAYVAVVTEAAPALPEIPDVEEEAELAEEAPIGPPGDCPLFLACLHMSGCLPVLMMLSMHFLAVAVYASLLSLPQLQKGHSFTISGTNHTGMRARRAVMKRICTSWPWCNTYS